MVMVIWWRSWKKECQSQQGDSSEKCSGTACESFETNITPAILVTTVAVVYFDKGHNEQLDFVTDKTTSPGETKVRM